MRLRPTPLALCILLAAITGASAAGPAPRDRAWIATCMDQLKRDNPNKQIVRKYCVCMHDYFEDNDKVSQSDMEHMYPLAHRVCNKSSGWR